MLKHLVPIFACAIVFTSALTTVHPEQLKKQAYSQYAPKLGSQTQQQNAATYQPSSAQSANVQQQPVSAKSYQQVGQFIPQYNAIPGQYSPALKQSQYYPGYPAYPSQYYPGTVQLYPPPPQNLFYGPTLGQGSRFPTSTGGTEQPTEGSGSWIGNWGSNLPAFSNFFPNFPTNFPTFSGVSGSPAAPGEILSQTGPGKTTNTDSNLAVVVGNRNEKPEKLQHGAGTSYNELLKSDSEKLGSDLQSQQYLFGGQFQYPQYFSQFPAFSNEKDPLQLNDASKGAISSYLFQPKFYSQSFASQPVVPQQTVTQGGQQQQLVAQQAVQQAQTLSQEPFYFPQSFLGQQTYLQQYAPQLIDPLAQPLLQDQNVYSQQAQQLSNQAAVQQLQPQKQVGEFNNLPGASLAYQRFLMQARQPEQPTNSNVPKSDISSAVSDAHLSTPTVLPNGETSESVPAEIKISN